MNQPDAAPTPRPLAGLRVAVTRPAEGADELAGLLRRAGALPIMLPLVQVVPTADLSELCDALAHEYDWAAFTSANAVRVVAATERERGLALRARRLAAVGRATEQAIRETWGRAPDVVPDPSTGEDLARAMAAATPAIAQATILWPRAATARDAFPETLSKAGGHVRDVAVYTTSAHEDNAVRLARLLARGEVDVLTFTSPSAVEALRAAGSSGDAAVIAVIGSTTAAAAAGAGFRVDVVPTDAGMAELVEAIGKFVQERRGGAGP